jgi:hypothetical protein
VATGTPKRGVSDYAVGDRCCAWEFTREDGTEGKLAYQNWKSIPIDMPVREWIDRLDTSEEAMSAEDSTVGMEPRSLGWKSKAQAVGFLKQHPLDELFIPPITIFRQTDELRDWIEQVEYQEREIAEHVAQVEAASDEEERRTKLNQFFPMARKSCVYPSMCPFEPLCFGSEDLRRDPLGSGKFVQRTPHHVPELRLLQGADNASDNSDD